MLNNYKRPHIFFCFMMVSLFQFSGMAYAKSPHAYWQERCSWHFQNRGSADGFIVYARFQSGVASARCWLYLNDHSRDSLGELIYPDGRRGVALYRMGSGNAPHEDANDNNSCDQGNPVSVSSGEKHQKESLFIVPGQPLFDLTLNYLSTKRAWRMPYSQSLVVSLRWQDDHWLIPEAWVGSGMIPVDEYDLPPQSNIQNYAVYLERPDGDYYTFYYQNNTWQEVHGENLSLSQLFDESGNPRGWRVINNRLTETYDLSGKLVSIESTEGSLSFTYQHQQTTISDSQGRSISFYYDENDNLVEVVDPDNNRYLLSYIRAGLLQSITFPSVIGTVSKEFLYEDGRPGHAALLTGIIDENNNRYATWAYDDSARAILSEHHNNADRVEFSFNTDSVSGEQYTTVTNELGKKADYYFSVIRNQKKLMRVEGHPSTNCAAANKAYTYDANGFLASKTDWKNNLTTYIHNDRGQELSRTEASGTPQARTITTEWHATFNLPVRIVEPERETLMHYDTNGRLQSREVRERSGL